MPAPFCWSTHAAGERGPPSSSAWRWAPSWDPVSVSGSWRRRSVRRGPADGGGSGPGQTKRAVPSSLSVCPVRSRGSVVGTKASGRRSRPADHPGVHRARWSRAGSSPGADEVDQTSERLPLVDGIRDHGLQLGAQPHRLHRGLDRNAVDLTRPTLQHLDLMIGHLATHFDELSSVSGDAATGLWCARGWRRRRYRPRGVVRRSVPRGQP